MSKSADRDGLFNEFYDEDFYSNYLNSEDIIESLAFDPDFNFFIDNNWSMREHTYKSRILEVEDNFLPEEINTLFNLPEKIYVRDINLTLSEYRNADSSLEEIESYYALSFKVDELDFNISPNNQNIISVYDSRFEEKIEIILDTNLVEKYTIDFLKAQNGIDNLHLEDILYDLATNDYSTVEIIKILSRQIALHSGESTKTLTTGLFSEQINKNVVVQKINTIRPTSENKSVTLHAGDEELNERKIYEYFLSTSMGDETDFITIAGQRDLSMCVEDLGIDLLTSIQETQLIDKDSGLDVHAKVINKLANAAINCSQL
jgi:hypothetical protein